MKGVPEVAGFISEPQLSFGYGQNLDDPRDGLFMFGPVIDHQKPIDMRIGVIGTPRGIDRFSRWVEIISGYIPSANSSSPHHFAFPGFEAVFKTKWRSSPIVEIPVSATEVTRCIHIADRHRAIYETVSLFEQPIRRKLADDDDQVDVWFVVIPDEVWLLGRPQSRIKPSERIPVGPLMNSRFARKLRNEPSLFPEDMEAAFFYDFEMDFHNQLKARLLDVRAVAQVVRESSLDEDKPDEPIRRIQDPATVAWNLCTTAFFKAGGRPWKLANVRDGVCYVGLVFKIDTSNPERGNACCGAQMFLDSGDGLVFKSTRGHFYSEKTREFHLSSDGAKKLIELVLESYRRLRGSSPTELFIHARTRFNENEWEGFSAAAPANTKIVGVRITRSHDMKLYRFGQMPVMRGTTFQLTRK